MKRLLPRAGLWALGLLLLTSVPATASAGDGSAISRPAGLRSWTTLELDNGLALGLANPAHVALVTEALLVVRAGTDFDPSPGGELAQVAAEALFAGTVPRSLVSAPEGLRAAADAPPDDGELETLRHYLARSGIELTSTVGPEMAVFRFSAPPRHAVALVHLLGAVLGRGEVSTEAWREAVLRRRAALQQQTVDRWSQANDQLRQLAWDDLPRAADERPEATSAEHVSAFLRRHYTGPRMALSLWGEFPLEMLREALIRRLSEVRPRGQAAAAAAAGSPRPAVHDPPPLLCLEAPGAAPAALFVALPTIADDDRTFYGWQMLAQTLGASHVSRLYQRLRFEENLSYTVEATCTTEGQRGLTLQITGQTDDVARSHAIVLEELARLGREPLSADELRRAQAMLRSRILLDHESLHDHFFRWSLGRLSERPVRTPERAAEVIAQLTSEDLRRLAAETLDPARSVALVVADRATGACGPAPPAAGPRRGTP